MPVSELRFVKRCAEFRSRDDTNTNWMFACTSSPAWSLFQEMAQIKVVTGRNRD